MMALFAYACHEAEQAIDEGIALPAELTSRLYS